MSSRSILWIGGIGLPVLVVLAAWVVLSIPHCSDYVSAVVQTENLSEALDRLRNDLKRHPSSEEGLSTIRHRPRTVSVDKWRGPYIKKSTTPRDPWGNDYVYIHPAIHGDKAYDLYSRGRNGLDEHGEGDDVPNWRDFEYDRHCDQNRPRRIVTLMVIAVAMLVFILLIGKTLLRMRQS